MERTHEMTKSFYNLKYLKQDREPGLALAQSLNGTPTMKM